MEEISVLVEIVRKNVEEIGRLHEELDFLKERQSAFEEKIAAHFLHMGTPMNDSRRNHV